MVSLKSPLSRNNYVTIYSYEHSGGICAFWLWQTYFAKCVALCGHLYPFLGSQVLA